jgi:hypothetical protein
MRSAAMKDSEFKNLSHLGGKYKNATRGIKVACGYKPDVTLRSVRGTLGFILESECKTDRKAFLGALIKAEVLAEEEGAHPSLVIVMKEFKNTTTKQIAEHLKPYFSWLSAKPRRTRYLSRVHVISDSDYRASIAHSEQLGSTAFGRRGHIL